MIVDQGENYISAPEISIISPSGIVGTGAVVSSSVQVGGAINSVSLISGGYDYTSEPTIAFTSASGTNGTGAFVAPTTNSWSASGYEFDHPDMLNFLSGPDWTPTGIPMGK